MTTPAPSLAACAADPNAGVVHRLVDVVDCHIKTLVQQSYRDLVGPDTPFGLAFTGLLTVYIALMGYQLILGRNSLRLTDLPVTALKVGLIMAFMTSWAVYQTLVYDLLFDGPRQVLAALLAPLARNGFSPDLYDGLEGAYAALGEAAQRFGAMASPNANILSGGPMLASGILWLSAIAMLLCTVGLILASKIALGFLLALGPIFIGLFLFETTRGFFDGWLRTAVTFALAPLAASVFGVGMVLMLTPFLTTLVEQARNSQFDMGLVTTIGLIVAVFLIVTAQSLRIGAGIAGGFASPRGRASGAAQTDVVVRDGRASGIPAWTDPRAAESAARAAAVDVTVERARNDDRPYDRRADVSPGVRDTRIPQPTLSDSYRRMPRPVTRRDRTP